jgi:LPS export ABC transporter protein LptC
MRLRYAFPLLALLAACGSEPERAGDFLLPEANDSIRSQALGVLFYFSDSARVRARMEAGRLQEKEVGDERNQVLRHYLDQGLKLYLLDGSGHAHTTITSREAVLDQAGGKAELIGEVVLVNDRGERMETEKLFWDKQRDSIYTRLPVKVITPDKTLFAERGMRASTRSSSYILFGIRGQVAADDLLP